MACLPFKVANENIFLFRFIFQPVYAGRMDNGRPSSSFFGSMYLTQIRSKAAIGFNWLQQEII
jgi:hypothetical protein